MDRRAFLALGAGCMAAAPALAQQAGRGPLQLIIPYAPGGGSDVLARPLAPVLSDRLQQPVVIENRGGAAGNIGTAAVAHAAPNGGMALIANNSQVINPYLYRDAGYDVARDFAPVALMATTPVVLVVPAAVPARSVADLLALARRQPGGLNFGSPGAGTPGHLAAVLFGQEAGIPLVHVPYRGSGPTTIALLAGEVQMSFSTAAAVEPHVRSGALRALAVTSRERFARFPDVPTVAELGVPQLADFEIDVWYGLWMPAATPPPVLDRVHAAMEDSLRDERLRQVLVSNALVPRGGSRAAFQALVIEESERWRKVIASNRITVD
jgi:tripartite-type tricarboxylate transporter receptor subunit TctC